MNYRATLIAAIQTVGLYAAAYIIPVLGQVLALLTPVPLILVSLRHGRVEGLAALGTSTALIAVLGGWQAAAILLFTFGLMAVGIAEGIRKQMKPEQISLLGGLLPISVIGISAAFYFTRAGKNPIGAIEGYLRTSIAEAASLYSKMGLNDMATMVAAVTDSFIHHLVMLIPAITIATSVIQAATCYGISRAVMLRKDVASPLAGQPALAVWHAPDAWVWGLIAALAILVVPNETSRYIGWNLAIIFAVVYLAQGTAIVEFYLKKLRIRPFMRGLILALILAMPSLVFAIALGIVDIWADFRKVRGSVL
ncbi:MAG TPA: DUF2232 domain-containing protein [Nitrospirota bacterium]|nr:DUF2232 domain-containing protein [Nitrospirota bacterium]